MRSSISNALAFALATKNRPAAIMPEKAERAFIIGLLQENGGN
jgi:hypothetical protein